MGWPPAMLPYTNTLLAALYCSPLRSASDAGIDGVLAGNMDDDVIQTRGTGGKPPLGYSQEIFGVLAGNG